jgi:hypothetical protein
MNGRTEDWQFAGTLRALHTSNPWSDLLALREAMPYLMTELWDRGFTHVQIREGFEKALAELPQYTGGEEIRS